MAPVQEPAVIVRSAYKWYGSKKDKRIVLNHLDMTVEKGSIYGLLGSSGCGKTTLLACLVGRRQLMSGTIQVLPGRKASVAARRIGYMPQEVALVGEFTVKNAVYYFGRLYGLEEDKIEERFSLLFKLLDLPDENRYVKNCSGGQQRRVSFAAALVHEPELLILDEPTVGLDPVLRANIWEHLIGVATKNNVAVIITTHYIEETRQADRIGLMRGGKLLAEDAPENVMRKYGCSSLEETFLLLSVKQSKADGGTEEPIVVESIDSPTDEVVVDPSGQDVNNHYESKDDFSRLHSSSRDVLTTEDSPKNNEISYRGIRLKKVKALLIKNMQQFGRHPGGFIFSLIFPIIQLLSFFIAVGHEPREIRIGIVNDEVPNWNDCLNNTYTSVFYNASEYTCQYDKLSCKYIQAFDESVIIKKFYPTLEDAINSVKRGEIIGALHLSSNFSLATEERQRDGRDASDSSIENSNANYWLDMSNHQLTIFLKKRLYSDYVNFNKDVLSECHNSPRLADIPIKFNDPVYGNADASYAEFMVPGVMLTIIFFLATTVTSTIIIMDRLEGVWDRTIVAGVNSSDILIVHFTLQTTVIFIQTIEIVILTFYGYQVPFKGDIINISCILFLQGMCGMCFGFLISIICDSYSFAFFVSTGSFYPMIMLCGIVWPVEGMALGVRYVSKALPFTIPIMSMRDIMEKGHTMAYPGVYIGYIITIAWILGLLTLCLLLLKLRRK
ncbi:ABC transporter G family member 20 [Arctopsyche grandis]|uniref:ABC transporter G family member 20 n=1 Tax=Arctopsyche grandis TaxID=121162 RepID=UPI00406D8AB8